MEVCFSKTMIRIGVGAGTRFKALLDVRVRVEVRYSKYRITIRIGVGVGTRFLRLC